MILALGCAGPAPVDSSSTAPDDTTPVVPGDTAVEVLPDPILCGPGATAPYVSEGETVSVPVACTGAGTAAGFAPVSLPPGATLTDGVFSWTPDLAQAGTWEVTVAVTDHPGDTGTFTVSVADAWANPGNVLVDPLTYQEEWGLPVLHLVRPEGTNEADDVATTATWRGHAFSIGLKYRGASSLYYPKNSYTLSFPADDEFEDDATGFVKRRKIVLTTLFDDNSYVRQKLCYDVWTALGEDHAPMQGLFAVVYINGVYEGLYLLGDHVDGEYWEDAGFSEEGNLYKSVDHAANFYATYNGRNKSSLHQGFEKKEGTPEDGQPGAWDDLDAFVQFVIEADEATFVAELPTRAHLPEFMDWWILVTFALAEDSGGKNAYLYDDPAASMWHFAPWDFNHSWGQAWESSRTSAQSTNDFQGANQLFARMLNDATLGPQLLERLHADMDGPLSEGVLHDTVDGYYALIDPSAARDWAKWEADYRSYYSWRSDFTSYEEEKAYLREWIAQRTRFMGRQYPE